MTVADADDDEDVARRRALLDVLAAAASCAMERMQGRLNVSRSAMNDIKTDLRGRTRPPRRRPRGGRGVGQERRRAAPGHDHGFRGRGEREPRSPSVGESTPPTPARGGPEAKRTRTDTSPARVARSRRPRGAASDPAPSDIS